MPKETLIVLACVGLAVACFWAAYRFKTRKKRKEKVKKRKLNQKIKDLSHCAVELTAEEFLKMRRQSFGKDGGERYVEKLNFKGVYILFNTDKNKYYVGQGVRVGDRVNRHFTGKGNGDVYADFKYGDRFTVRMIALKRSGFKSLNALERNTIEAYRAYASGYNKTRGNCD